MSTAQCEIGIVRIRVGLINDILRFNYKYSTIFSFRKFKYHLFLSLIIGEDVRFKAFEKKIDRSRKNPLEVAEF